jgi:hypothetical protein
MVYAAFSVCLNPSSFVSAKGGVSQCIWGTKGDINPGTPRPRRTFRFTGLGGQRSGIMFRSASIRWGVVAAVGAVFFAGCGAVQNPTLPQGHSALASHRTHRASGSSGDLLYVSQSVSEGWNIVMLTYPQGKAVGTIVPPNQPFDICSDSSGNVWAPTQQVVYEYGHGGTSPIQTLSAPGLFMNACAVDPSTGNLAVVGEDDYGTPTIAIWSGGQGSPTSYSPPFWGRSLAYDASGNLFMDGNSDSKPFLLGELPKSSSTFTTITLDQPTKWPGEIDWDGRYLAVATGNTTNPKGQKHVVYRVEVSGSSGHVVQTVVLENERETYGGCIHGKVIVGVHYKNGGTIDFWHYPEGGKPFQKLTGYSEPEGLTVSVAPSGSHK